AAALFGDVAVDATVLLTAYRLTRLGLELAGVNLPHIDEFWAHHVPPSAHQPLPGPVHTTIPTPEPANPGTDSRPPAPPAPTTEHPLKPFEATYVALSHDPANDGRPSNITDMARQSLTHYGQEAGLSKAEIHKLTHDDAVIDKLIHA